MKTFFNRLQWVCIPLVAALLAACGGSAVQGGKVPPVLMVSTLAGTAGVVGHADGTGAAASFSYPKGITADVSGNLYVADYANHTIRKITPAGVVSTLAGTAGVADSAGSADGTGAAAWFSNPAATTADASGNLYVADYANHTIRKITPAGVVSTLAGKVGDIGSADGTGAAARFFYPSGITADVSGNLYVADSYNRTIRKIDPGGVVSTLAGTAGVAGSVNDTGAKARFYYPTGIALDSTGNLYVADTHNRTIRKITPGGVVSTLAGTAGVAGSADGAGAAAHFEAPTGISLDSTGNLYVTDSNNNNIRKITPAGVVSTLAGRAGESGSADGTVAAARFNGPMGISVAPNGNLYVADYVNHTIRKIGPGYYVGGTVSGLKGALILRNSNGDTKTINAYGKFTLDTPVAEGLTYAVTVQTQPPGQTCTVTGGSGTATDHVSNIDVSCTGTAVTAYTIGGTVSGLTGKLVLQNSNGDKKTIDANSSFTFTARVVTGGAYKVTVLTDPVGQTCTVSSGSGTASATVNNVSVSCAASTYTIGGTVSGLTAGTLVLQNNTSDNLTLMTNGNFTFATAITHGRAYAVTVLTQPTGQTCTVRDALSANASGTARVNVATITVSCVTNTYTIGGTVSGLTAGTLVLQNNGGDNKSLTADGNFTFTTPVTGAYSVTVLTQPAGQTCTVTSGSGTAAANVSNVAVSCANNPAPTYTIGGAVSGLTGTLVLQNNAGDNLSLTTNASFTFATPVTGAYSVTVLTQPAGQTCSMTSGSGTAAANVSNVAVSCSSNGSSATTLAGSGMLGSADGTGVAASFDTPFGITSDSAGNLYVTDSFGQIIRKTTPAGVVSTIAGTVATPGSADGTGAAASFSFPQGVAVDSAGNLFVADSGNHTIRKITSAGVVSTIAGTAGGFGSVDGTGAAARFIGPGGIAVDSAGNLFVADSGNHTIRKITSAGVVTTVAGSAVTPGITDGTGAVARFNGPGGIAIDATGNLFVADTGNHTIRKITSAGVVTTVAGTAGLSGSTDATGTATKFNTPFGVTVDSAGNLFVADTYNNTIRKIDTLGVVTTVAGTAGVSGSTNATGAAASFSSPTHITVDPAGNLFVTDMGNNMIRKVTP